MHIITPSYQRCRYSSGILSLLPSHSARITPVWGIESWWWQASHRLDCVLAGQVYTSHEQNQDEDAQDPDHFLHATQKGIYNLLPQRSMVTAFGCRYTARTRTDEALSELRLATSMRRMLDMSRVTRRMRKRRNTLSALSAPESGLTMYRKRSMSEARITAKSNCGAAQ